MLTFYKKYARTIFDIALLVLTVYIIMWLFSLFYSIAKPIFMALLIFIVIEPIAKFFHKRGLKKIISTTLATLIFVLIIVGAIVTAGVIFTNEIIQLANSIPKYTDFIQSQIGSLSDRIKSSLDTLPPEVIDKIEGYANQGLEFLGNFLSRILNSFGGAITFVTSFIVNFVLGLILAYFLSLEFEKWKKIANEKTPRTFKNAFYFLKENVIKGLLTYIKAQSILVTITFLTILISLLILGVHNAFSIALLSAVFDILPVLGVSTVFVPWIIYLLIVGDYALVIWIIILYAFVVVTRQLLEPKITGQSLGVSAFTMLSFMIISLSLFGVIGVILSPVLLVLIKALYDQGYISKWIRKPEGEYPDDLASPNTNITQHNIDLNDSKN